MFLFSESKQNGDVCHFRRRSFYLCLFERFKIGFGKIRQTSFFGGASVNSYGRFNASSIDTKKVKNLCPGNQKSIIRSELSFFITRAVPKTNISRFHNDDDKGRSRGFTKREPGRKLKRYATI